MASTHEDIKSNRDCPVVGKKVQIVYERVTMAGAPPAIARKSCSNLMACSLVNGMPEQIPRCLLHSVV